MTGLRERVLTAINEAGGEVTVEQFSKLCHDRSGRAQAIIWFRLGQLEYIRPAPMKDATGVRLTDIGRSLL